MPDQVETAIDIAYACANSDCDKKIKQIKQRLLSEVWEAKEGYGLCPTIRVADLGNIIDRVFAA